MKLLLLTASTMILASAQTTTPSGAKALFFSPESGQQTVNSSAASPPGSQRTPVSGGATSALRLTGRPAVTGLKYYIQLRQPNGNLQRVNVNRVFHSGDRIRLIVAANVDGDLVIYQKQEDLPEQRLYPAPEVQDATGHITPGATVTLPSTHGSFVFDDHPGQIHLTLMFTARLGQADSQTPTAGLAHQLAGATKGSKALHIEDDSADDNAEYKVLDSLADSKIPAGVVATEVTLSHDR